MRLVEGAELSEESEFLASNKNILLSSAVTVAEMKETFHLGLLNDHPAIKVRP
jgi:hypothetical protein